MQLKLRCNSCDYAKIKEQNTYLASFTSADGYAGTEQGEYFSLCITGLTTPCEVDKEYIINITTESTNENSIRGYMKSIAKPEECDTVTFIITNQYQSEIYTELECHELLATKFDLPLKIGPTATVYTTLEEQ